jgi:hypothetical protein
LNEGSDSVFSNGGNKPSSNFGRDRTGDLSNDLEAWITRDQRELPLNGMENQHLHSAIAALTRWRGHETDDDKRAELKQWIARFKNELKHRVKAAERELRQRQGAGKRPGRFSA